MTWVAVLLTVQDVLILLDLIGTKSTRFANWFPKMENLYTQLQNIGKLLSCICNLFSDGNFSYCIFFIVNILNKCSRNFSVALLLTVV